MNKKIFEIFALLFFVCSIEGLAQLSNKQLGEQKSGTKQGAEKINKLEGELFYGYEDDGSFVYAMFLKKTDKENEYEVAWTLPFYDQKYRNGEIFILSKNSGSKVQFKRGRPEYHLYDAEIDTKGNLVNGSRFVLEKSKNYKTKWNLFKVK